MKSFLKILSTILFCCSFFLLGCQTNMPPPKKILFVGNSLTFYNDMPKMLQMMLNESDAHITVDQSTFPGFSLDGHLNSIIIKEDENMVYTREKEPNEFTKTELKLQSNQYDVVVLQEQTGQVLIPEIRNLRTERAIEKFRELAEPNAQILLFQNFPTNATYPKSFCKKINTDPNTDEKTQFCSDTIGNLRAEMQGLKDAFVQLKGDKNTINIGESFYNVMNQNPNLNLYEDDSHPSLAGSFLIALQFYKCLTNKNPQNLKYIGSLNATDADYLKTIAKDCSCH